jgi:hypothetical protein
VRTICNRGVKNLPASFEELEHHYQMIEGANSRHLPIGYGNWISDDIAFTDDSDDPAQDDLYLF